MTSGAWNPRALLSILLEDYLSVACSCFATLDQMTTTWKRKVPKIRGGHALEVKRRYDDYTLTRANEVATKGMV